jgi:ABC-type glycerol-3-phosphate transport system substrate-binding protein
MVPSVESQGSIAVESTPITLTVWHTVSPQQEETLQAIANGWSRQQPLSVTVELRSLSGAESMHQELLAAIQTQQTPDLAFIRPSDAYVYAEADELLPLDNYWSTFDNDTQSDYVGSFLTANQCIVNDNAGLWAMPTHRYQTVFYVNKTRLTEELNGTNPPATWEALVNDCNRHVAQTQYACLTVLPTQELATLLFFSHDNPVIHPATAQTTLTDNSALTALHQLTELRDSQALQTTLSYDGAVLDFVEGRTLFTIDNTDALEGYTEAIGDTFEWEVVPLPAEGTTPRTLASGGNLAVFRTTPEREALSLSFLTYLTNTEVNARWAEAMDALPIRHSSLEWLTTKSANPQLEQAASLLPSSHSVPCLPQWQTVEDQLTQLVTDTLNGVAPPESLLSSAVQSANNLLR